VKRLYLDLVGGAAGDMLMAALIDAGASADRIRGAHQAMGLDGVTLEVHTVRSAGLRALQVDVRIHGALADQPEPEGSLPPLTHLHDPTEAGHHHRPYRIIRDRLAASTLSEPVQQLAQAAFRHLAEAEARVHGVDVDQVEFHEVGADDAIADVVGVCQALVDLEVAVPGGVFVSPVPLGRGRVTGAHGPIPLPGPAALRILEGAPVEPGPEGETVTPTGAALLRAMEPTFGPMPAMVLEGVGVGAGHRSWADRPNVVRALVGRHDGVARAGAGQAIVEACVDDLLPLHVPEVLSALFEAGAADAWAEPVSMKKGRPGLKLCALCSRPTVDGVADALLRASSTAGVRWWPVERRLLPRRTETVSTRFGALGVKVVQRPGGLRSWAPEPDDCHRAAQEHGVPEREVYEAALAAAREKAGGFDR
jgi:hypothetical protein